MNLKLDNCCVQVGRLHLWPMAVLPRHDPWDWHMQRLKCCTVGRSSVDVLYILHGPQFNNPNSIRQSANPMGRTWSVSVDLERAVRTGEPVIAPA